MVCASRIFLLLIAFSFLSTCGTWQAGPHNSVGPLSSTAGHAITYSGYRPFNPYSQLADGIMARTLFTTSSRRGFSVEVRDLLVGPGMRSASISFPDAAVFEVQSGSGIIILRNNPREIHTGSMLSVAEGETFTLENKGDIAIAIRAHLLRATE